MNGENRFDDPVPDADLVLRTKDHPEAYGGKPQDGDQQYTVIYPLEDGRILHILMGRDGFQRHRDMIAQMDADDAAERLLGDL